MSRRGAIELVASDVVAGWVSSTSRSLRGAPVLAFLGRDCIGAGRVELHRPDIAGAELGDGWAGFLISTVRVDDAQFNDVYVKLEGEDAILVRPEYHQRAAPPPPQRPAREVLEKQQQSVRWMRERGWVTPENAEVLRKALLFGACEMRLPPGGEGSPIEQARAALAGLLALMQRRDVTVASEFCRDAEALAAAMQAQRADHPHRLLGLWSMERNRMAVAEGSHLEGQPADAAGQLVGVNYEFGAGKMLLLHPLAAVIPPPTLSQTLLLHAAE